MGWHKVREKTFVRIYFKKKKKKEKIGPTVHESHLALTAKEGAMHRRGQRSADQSSVPSIKAGTFSSDCYTGRV